MAGPNAGASARRMTFDMPSQPFCISRGDDGVGAQACADGRGAGSVDIMFLIRDDDLRKRRLRDGARPLREGVSESVREGPADVRRIVMPLQRSSWRSCCSTPARESRPRRSSIAAKPISGPFREWDWLATGLMTLRSTRCAEKRRKALAKLREAEQAGWRVRLALLPRLRPRPRLDPQRARVQGRLRRHRARHGAAARPPRRASEGCAARADGRFEVTARRQSVSREHLDETAPPQGGAVGNRLRRRCLGIPAGPRSTSAIPSTGPSSSSSSRPSRS